MSVRGTTHARHTKRVIIRKGQDEGGRILCAWDDCDRDGTTLHYHRICEHKDFVPCDSLKAQHAQYVFCSERHRQFWLHSHRKHGQLPSGWRSSIL
jgi:hypothetical protein